MMDSMESCVPPGFRFHPTDEELVGYYLKKKVASQKIDLDVIREVDLYRIEPWDLQDRCRFGYEEQTEWYFFSHKDKKYPTGTRTNRATMAGFWKATGRDKAVQEKRKLIGMRKTLVFYKGRAPNGQKTDWIVHEYRLEFDHENGPPKEEGWVVCRAFKKRPTSCQARSNADVFEEPNSNSSRLQHSAAAIADPIDPSLRRQPNYSLHLKQEGEHEGLSTLLRQLNPNINFFQELPQLESPNSLPLTTKPSISLSVAYDQNDSEEVHAITGCNRVTDWRALDKFVASQLSQHDAAVGDFSAEEGSEMALLLFESGREEESKLNELLDAESEIGCCIFEK